VGRGGQEGAHMGKVQILVSKKKKEVEIKEWGPNNGPWWPGNTPKEQQEARNKSPKGGPKKARLRAPKGARGAQEGEKRKREKRRGKKKTESNNLGPKEGSRRHREGPQKVQERP
jgi:hypothetical protein